MNPASAAAEQRRPERLRAGLERLDAAALLVVAASPRDPDLAPWVGASRIGEAFLVVARGAAPRLGYWTPMERDEAASTGLDLLSPELLGVARLVQAHGEPGALLAAVLAAALDQCGIAPGRLAIAGCWPAGALVEATTELARRGWSFVSGAELLRGLRKRKEPHELLEMRRVAATTGATQRAIAAILAAARADANGELWAEGRRLTVDRLKREAALGFAAAGLDQPRACIVAPGEEGGVPHTGGSGDRVLRAGESLVVDLFPRGRLYADCTRTFCVGSAPEALLRAHGDVREALSRAYALLAPGISGWSLQEEVCALLAARGWPTPISQPGAVRGYVHNLGHGVGYELHEQPSFRQQARAEEGRIEVGDVLTLEPGLYEPGESGFGVRLEDMVAVGSDEVENLTPLPYELDPRAW